MSVEPAYGPCGRHAIDEAPCWICAAQEPFRLKLEAMRREVADRGRFMTDPVDRRAAARAYYDASRPLVKAIAEIEFHDCRYRYRVPR